VTKAPRWFLSTYAAAWLEQKVTFQDWVHCQTAVNEDCRPVEWSVDMSNSAIVFGAGTAFVLLVAFVAMRRRDVT
jgi:ABC-2 type transport system permease protein